MQPYQTQSLCRVCKNAVPATVLSRGAEIWMEKRCPEHGEQEVQLSDDAGWYERTRATKPRLITPSSRKPVHLGCPFDCGACEQHQQGVRLPVITITSSCNLDCPICYVYNKNENAFFMGREEFGQILSHLVQGSLGGTLELLNLTGGEPTLHPELLDFLAMARAAGIHRVSLCTNGIKLARDEALVAKLAELGARIALSFDSFEEEADYVLQGAHLVELKLRCLELLEKYDVDTTLIPVMTRGVNEAEVGRILQFAMGLRNVRHVEVHTMTYTGQGGTTFGSGRTGRISMHEVLRTIEKTTGGWLRPGDFVPSPCAHPLCYQVAYLLVDPTGGPPVPFTRFLSPETLYDCLADHLYLEPTPRLERAFRDAIDQVWATSPPDSERILRLLKDLLGRLFPTDRELTAEQALRVSEDSAKAVYVHSHMDEETFDVERIQQCCDSDCFADGSTIPVCAYNILYRDKQERFMKRPRAWDERRRGKLP
jgi:uncharacterized radical SAM superfamily Fe-S cluster-containing enzyme